MVSKRGLLGAAVCVVLTGGLAAPMASAGEVGPIERCGGYARGLKVNVSGHKGRPPVRVVAGRNVTVTASFIPARSAASAKFRFVAETRMGQFPIASGKIGPLRKGVRYKAGGTIRPSGFFAGRTVTVRATVTSGSFVELCMRVPVKVAAR
ncbi:hypothetical protein [Spirillospora sp. CA-294931]|uniref:hypothetical protein n=1 Tax=Spirillospora sp. CA-294931 TaxID=3240042 RepID=UPI003D8A11F2